MIVEFFFILLKEFNQVEIFLESFFLGMVMLTALAHTYTWNINMSKEHLYVYMRVSRIWEVPLAIYKTYCPMQNMSWKIFRAAEYWENIFKFFPWKFGKTNYCMSLCPSGMLSCSVVFQELNVVADACEWERKPKQTRSK